MFIVLLFIKIIIELTTTIGQSEELITPQNFPHPIGVTVVTIASASDAGPK